jgi:hypothetical protein
MQKLILEIRKSSSGYRSKRKGHSGILIQGNTPDHQFEYGGKIQIWDENDEFLKKNDTQTSNEFALRSSSQNVNKEKNRYSMSDIHMA